MESWRDIPGWEGEYRVSDAGRVRSLKSGRTLRQHRGRGGYMKVCLCRGGKIQNALVHGLVLSAFVGPRPDGMEARHRDGVRGNNRLDNLAWGTKLENAADRDLHGTSPVGERNPRAVLTKKQVLEICALAESGSPQNALAQNFGVSEITISHILCGRTWASVTGRRHVRRRAQVDEALVQSMRAVRASGATIDQVARRFGVSPATAYRHSKSEVTV